MKIDPVATEKCAAQLDATDTHVEFAKGKLRATEGKDLGDLSDAMNAARSRVSGALSTVTAVQKEISQNIRSCTKALVEMDQRNAGNLSDTGIKFPVLN
ncbi:MULTISPECIES: hypothetical protein [Mycobacteroides]|jgi:DNA transposition AAA+ family ATPase|uniref:Uncharacterized protein n=1 Tax=Mycobacteroides chelonae TaxID=1774 RepID=A0A1S1KVV9_MYCCH|nr:hypothetical protein [Mycobacteroides chelonae]AMW22114.1 hypothetical protein Chelonae_p4363 [Mycobacterium sp. QIA-37]PKQ57723.1 hypothetical protein B5566_13260 [Mycobacterium sp. MHSD3]SKL39742.1 Uncharacterised protein [Mycobacteroides abscessus subsp. bolletii]AYM44125.1 hypothetical protein DYE20_23640 [[Mycobacterium] chelonae subsp. gwanakae]MBF9329630.1 hypothetical protein [Mycobacteroides chelonae]